MFWRDTIALTRAPGRLVWASALAAAAAVEATVHPGRPLPAGLAAVALYFAAGALLEPLRIDIDDPDKSRLLLSWPFARVLVAHCVLPVITLVIVTGVALAACFAFGSAGAGVLALIPTLLVALAGTAVVCAALGARGGGRIGGSVLLRVTDDRRNRPVRRPQRDRLGGAVAAARDRRGRSALWSCSAAQQHTTRGMR